ncbi:MAG: hypothetical protein GEU98_26540 [Pseudonocardiaceae bacterium]|nr:hypothetical protein [Pseudonocardiaceae bacterium]
MSRKRMAMSLISAALGVALLSACGQEVRTVGNAQPAPVADAGSGSGQVALPASGSPKLTAVELDGLGQVLTDQDGFTLYRFDKDNSRPPQSNCDGECTTKWPPMLTEGPVQVEGVDQDAVGTVARADGTKQVTVGNWPVYRFAEDTAPGQANGHGVGGNWFAVDAQGGKAGEETPPGENAPPTEEAPQESGTKVVATEIDGVGPALTDQDGRTLYLFEEDSKEPPEATCEGDCARQWPPLLAEGDVQIEGVDENLVGSVTRADGTEQVTVGGWPVYRFAKDTAPGQANGHGVGGTWFVIEPAGCKSSAPVQPEGSQPQESPAPEDSGTEDTGTGTEEPADSEYGY